MSTDGKQTLYTSTASLIMNGADRPRFEHLVREYFGVNDVVYLEPLPGETIKHIDMMFRIVNETTCLLAEYPEDVPASTAYQDYFHREIRATLERNREILEKRFPTIIRVPMPVLRNTRDTRIMFEASLAKLSGLALPAEDWSLLAPGFEAPGFPPTFRDAVIESALTYRRDTGAEPRSRSRMMRDIVKEWGALDDEELTARVDAAIAELVDQYNEGVRQESPDEARLDELKETIKKLKEYKRSLRPTTIYRTYMNAVHLRNQGRERVLVPRYRGNPALEAVVRKRFEQAYPNAKVVFVSADELIEQFGALHCMTCVIPSELRRAFR